MKLRKKLSDIALNVMMWLISLVVLTPVVLIFINAFKTKTEAASMSMALPEVIQWSNFAVVIEQGKLVLTFLNSMVYSSVSVIFGVLLSSMAAFVLARRRTKLNVAIYFFYYSWYYIAN